MNDASIPLCVALDGTLTPVRTAHERLLALAKQSPIAFWRRLLSLIRGTRAPPEHTAARSQVDVTTLPFRPELLEWLREQRRAGRRLVLVVDGDRTIAEQVAAHLDLFDEVATTETFEGSPAQRKRSALMARFGEQGFDYAGSEASDKIVWDASRRAIVVGDASIGKRISLDPELVEVYPAAKASL